MVWVITMVITRWPNGGGLVSHDVSHHSRLAGVSFLRFFLWFLWTVVVREGMEELSIEVMQYMVFRFAHTAEDVLALALTSRTVYGKLLGGVGEENEFDRDQHRATAGVAFCCQHRWWRAARLAVQRGYGDVNASWVLPDFYPGYPMDEACKNGEMELVRVLLKHPDVDPKARNGYAIKMAALNNHHAVLALLLADPRVGDVTDWIPVPPTTT